MNHFLFTTLPTTTAMKPPFKSACITAIIGLLVMLCLNLYQSGQLQQAARERQAYWVEVVVTVEPPIPAHVENIARKYLAGHQVSDMELGALSNYIEKHTDEWNAWAETQNAVTLAQPF